MNADLEEEKELEYTVLYAEAIKEREAKTNKYIYVSEFTDM